MWGALAIGIWAGALEVGGAAACPTPEEVAGRLVALLPADLGGGPSGLARIDETARGLEVELRDAQGMVLEHRAIDRARPCSDLADAAAVMIAAWAGALPENPIALSPPHEAPHSLEIGLALFASLATDATIRPGLLLEGSIAWARLALFGSWLRDGPIGTGSYTWLRAGMSLGARVDIPGSPLEMRADLIAALLSVGGQGLPAARREWDFDPGASLGLRARLPFGPFVELQAIGWFRPQSVEVAGLSARAALPRAEALLLFGVPIGGPR